MIGDQCLHQRPTRAVVKSGSTYRDFINLWHVTSYKRSNDKSGGARRPSLKSPQLIMRSMSMQSHYGMHLISRLFRLSYAIILLKLSATYALNETFWRDGSIKSSLDHSVISVIEYTVESLSSSGDWARPSTTSQLTTHEKNALLLAPGRKRALWRKVFTAHTNFAIVFMPLMIATILFSWALRHNELLPSANTCWTQYPAYMCDGDYDLGIWANSRREERIHNLSYRYIFVENVSMRRLPTASEHRKH